MFVVLDGHIASLASRDLVSCADVCFVSNSCFVHEVFVSLTQIRQMRHIFIKAYRINMRFTHFLVTLQQAGS